MLPWENKKEPKHDLRNCFRQNTLFGWCEIQFRGFGWSDSVNDDTLEDMFPVLEQNEESSKPALASSYTNTMGNDNLYVQAV